MHKDHTTYKTAPAKKDLHVVSWFLSFGDEVANTEESTVLVSLMVYVVGTEFKRLGDRHWFIKTVLRKYLHQ